ncbi:pyridoxal-phosphate dependent enzyme [Streptomyces sp. NPDC002742]|uniref:pyridoxal-phosphate dependent enzyme n=1 Tax=Streptomyces sp. NPDC002742 TaxID=3364663 RepID=UPI003676849C
MGEIHREGSLATPIVDVQMECQGRRTWLALKLEKYNATGSVKDRTARGLLHSLANDLPLRPGTVVVESTSGNLGLGLAGVLSGLDCRLIAVVDPKTSEITCEAMRSMGAEIHLVDEPDGTGGYLLSRLRRVRQLCAENPDYRWTDQYDNVANPRVHEEFTGPELLSQLSGNLDTLYVAVSTGGTLSGISAYLRHAAPEVRLVAVDSVGSHATGWRTDGDRIIPGIGSSRRSSFLGSHSYDRVVKVDSAASIALCRLFRLQTGISLGGSSGSVIHAVLCDQMSGEDTQRPAALCADGGEAYEDTIYNDEWLERIGVAKEVDERLAYFCENGVSFRAQGTLIESGFTERNGSCTHPTR